MPPTFRRLTAVSAPLAVRPISAAQHLAAVTEASGSFLQTPAWGAVKSDWRSESLGWFDGDSLVGAGLVLYRAIPRLGRSLAYLPEGPVLDWEHHGADAVTTPLLAHLRRQRCFTVKMGPPVVARRWQARTVKDAIAAADMRRLSEVPADEESSTATGLTDRLRATGWRQQASSAGFGDFQPRYVFCVPLEGRTTDEVFAGFNQLWRRNVRKAEKAGVEVSQGSAADLAAFHEIYVETAARDSFRPRPLGRHVWYSYGASTTEGRELRPSNAIQWQMIQDAHATGASVYDLRGISDTLDEDDPLFGLIQFKLGTGGEVVEYVGEWDYPLNRLLHKAFTYYLGRR
jgi:lipid II:glycine glycyltransferase (peptidoglycan interpeptide bridge formation enzyme)